ncbi:hypothetical protein HanXRQr2_Chr01g0027911 [Helianthus annuus]|uniref:Uncharacterized protein n=1 Tax=Helianthus annuus TaxID=4232 RepID=A0A9K3JWM8_HELAN|nr:hypothetical protein HanXRQr2_Chr01g0027911 [Helianthus annuus]
MLLIIAVISGGRFASSTLTWCRVRHWWAIIGDTEKPRFDP